ncbi:hypothetical protein AB0M43_35660 [Longispora sp. NPDC051575]|uniref:hypothetical protein n=1 Tax=Longispora sp. NPDC051575 TaxID=3154943 RepID=UPI0034156A4B
MDTAPLPPEFQARLAGLEAFGRTTTRLHPRPGPVTAADSHVGGPLLWPSDEPWPVCDIPHQELEDVPLPAELLERLAAAEARRTQRHVLADGESALLDELARLVGPGYIGWGTGGDGPAVGHRYASRAHVPPNPLVAVAQLRAADIPDLPRPGGADLLQVLWCPFDHPHDGIVGPTLRLRWRREADVRGEPAEPPVGASGEEEYLPRACRLHPEQVVEYPDPSHLPPDLRAEVASWPEDYGTALLAPGWKVGGHAAWTTTDPVPTPCPRCSGPTGLLLVIASAEYDGGTRDRWRPVEERHIDWAHPDRLTLQEPTGVQVGRWGSLRLFACLTCPDTPLVLNLQ